MALVLRFDAGGVMVLVVDVAVDLGAVVVVVVLVSMRM